MGIIQAIMNDFEKLIGTQFMIPLDNKDTIKFTFNQQNLPHLLGLQYLVDIPALFEYHNGRMSATKLVKGMRNGSIDTRIFEKSIYFDDIYNNRMKYFSSDLILDIIKCKQIVRFNPRVIKDFSTKLDKLEYLFWKVICNENDNFVYFGIGFTSAGKCTEKNYPNTFFVRTDSQYIDGQQKVFPMSLMIKKRNKEYYFEINWDFIRASMKKNVHYKFLMNRQDVINYRSINLDKNCLYNNTDTMVAKHYQLLLLDELEKAYSPYMKESFRWTNSEKEYIRLKSEKEKKTFLPNEIIVLLNQFRQNDKNSN